MLCASPSASRARPRMLALAARRIRAASCALAESSGQAVERKRRGLYHQGPRGPTHFVAAGQSGPPLLLLPGFGVGTFHWESQIEELSQSHRVFAIDFLGQGQSWPDVVDGLTFSCELWAEQVEDFIANVVKEPAFLVGNSLGGFVSVMAASGPRQDLVRGLVLLNATPFWSGAPNPATSPQAAAAMPWGGTLPAPWPLRLLVGVWWSLLRSPATVRALLGLVYADARRVDDALVAAILEPTTRPQAREVFCSIFFSPQAPLSFNEMLARVECPVALVYGREDPWVVPLWGQRLKRQIPSALYYELSPAGHCPHHESPAVTNALIAGWVGSVAGGGPAPLLDGSTLSAEGVTAVLADGAPRNVFEKADFASYQQQQQARAAAAGGGADKVV